MCQVFYRILHSIDGDSLHYSIKNSVCVCITVAEWHIPSTRYGANQPSSIWAERHHFSLCLVDISKPIVNGSTGYWRHLTAFGPVESSHSLLDCKPSHTHTAILLAHILLHIADAVDTAWSSSQIHSATTTTPRALCCHNPPPNAAPWMRYNNAKHISDPPNFRE